ncbi:hypothetical protein N3K63_14905 [Microbacterium sp. W1N]|uniref:hypothetical protein n=1 Tax=Microbacterium festucae TaxID=2977531 RepID=UPI0021C01E8E|nr:hypothetical protein [Microbacterium festucae]MCT9821574.1 hypothetical protein [Microbacterium festucae]
MTTRRGFAVFAVILGLAVTGCAPTPLTAPTEAPPTAATPSPTPTPAPEWTIAFGGSCDNMLTDDQLASILGEDVMEHSTWLMQRDDHEGILVPSPPDAEGTAGGLSCTWLEDSSSEWGGERLTLLALPTQAVGPAMVSALAEEVCEPSYDTTVCRLGLIAGDTWLVASRGTYEGAESPTATLQAALAAAAENAPLFPAPVPEAKTDQWWPIVECRVLGDRMGLADVLGAGYWSGYWEGSRQREDDIFEHAGVRQFCQYGSGEGRSSEAFYIVSITSAPGGAWRWERTAAEGGDPMSVEGARAAARRTTDREGFVTDRVVATDGVNVVDVLVEGGAIAPDIAARAMSALAG